MDKKTSSDWYIAATHYLTGLLAPKIVGNIILIIFFGFINNLLGITSSQIIFLEVLSGTLIIVWFGTMYGARYVNSHYVIKNANSVVNIATIYCLAINVVFWHFFLIARDRVFSWDLISSILSSIAVSIVFYFGSKKFIKNNIEA